MNRLAFKLIFLNNITAASGTHWKCSSQALAQVSSSQKINLKQMLT